MLVTPTPIAFSGLNPYPDDSPDLTLFNELEAIAVRKDLDTLDPLSSDQVQEYLRVLVNGMLNNEQKHFNNTTLHTFITLCKLAKKHPQADEDKIKAMFKEALQFLVNTGFDVNGGFKNQIPLHLTAENDSVLLCSVLIELGGHFEKTNYMNETPLHRACAVGNIEVVRMLIEKGANVKALKNQNRTTMMSGANYPEIIKLLHEKGVDVNSVASNLYAPTVLHAAVELNNFDSVKLLFDLKVAVNESDYKDLRKKIIKKINSTISGISANDNKLIYWVNLACTLAKRVNILSLLNTNQEGLTSYNQIDFRYDYKKIKKMKRDFSSSGFCHNRVQAIAQIIAKALSKDQNPSILSDVEYYKVITEDLYGELDQILQTICRYAKNFA